jgi:GNAT superfamily N-acetyltransferase
VDVKYLKIKTGDLIVRLAEPALSATIRGAGIGARSTASIRQKIMEGKAVIAVTKRGQWAGFSYIEVWGKGKFVSNSGLIVTPAFRGHGIAGNIKKKTFALSRKLYPWAAVFSITTSLAIMKMNEALGFKTVTFNEITREKTFWRECKGCVNYTILESKQCKNCLCTAMLYIPADLQKSAVV